MIPSMGTVILVASAVFALVAALLLRRRLPAGVVLALLIVAGAGIATGGLLLRPAASPFEIVATLAVVTVLVPAHVRVVLGPFGPRR
jgi:hypothetical protein